MKTKAEGLPVNTLIIIIIALLVLVVTIIFFSAITGKEIFPSVMEKVRMALGLWNQSSSGLP